MGILDIKTVIKGNKGQKKVINFTIVGKNLPFSKISLDLA